ncbi:hypothetical protein ACHQM5_022537 [Ranunculus cassubicifolius]
MASNLLTRPSMHTTPKTLKPSICFSSIKSNNLAFCSQRTQSVNSLSIKNYSSTQSPKFLSSSPQSPNPIFKSTNHKTICQATYETVPATDRLISILSYFIPFLGGLSYGYHLFSAFPNFEHLFNPLVPLVGFYKSIPGSNFLTFIGLYIGIVRDKKKFSRFVRFNALQALFLEFLLVVPSLLHLVFTHGEGLGFRVLQVIHSGVFMVILAYFVYTLGFCLFGKTPYFPYVTDAMDLRLSLEDRCG